MGKELKGRKILTLVGIWLWVLCGFVILWLDYKLWHCNVEFPKVELTRHELWIQSL